MRKSITPRTVTEYLLAHLQQNIEIKDNRIRFTLRLLSILYMGNHYQIYHLVWFANIWILAWRISYTSLRSHGIVLEFIWEEILKIRRQERGRRKELDCCEYVIITVSEIEMEPKFPRLQNPQIKQRMWWIWSATLTNFVSTSDMYFPTCT